ncbi:PepSY domain-containing protein [Streptomyces sp. NPDC050610]|uniref:PepSY domain-containing protein n=1 Tax=Streptomyces sp. NPDC050610 TaxID=3157097 RepID=UPI0034129DE3
MVRTRWGRAAGVLCGVVVSAALVSGCGDDGGGGSSSSSDSSASSGSPASSGSSGSAPSSAPASGSASAGTSGLTEDQAERKALLPTAKVGYEKAARTAAAAVPNGKVAEIELKKTADGSEWRSKVAARDGTAHEVNVDAGSGKVTRSRTEPDQDGDDKRKLADRLGKAKVTAQQAVRTSTERKPGTTTAVEIDGRDDGTVIWSVDLVNTGNWNKTTFDVDVTNGKVLREHVDRD